MIVYTVCNTYRREGNFLFGWMEGIERSAIFGSKKVGEAKMIVTKERLKSRGAWLKVNYSL